MITSDGRAGAASGILGRQQLCAIRIEVEVFRLPRRRARRSWRRSDPPPVVTLSAFLRFNVAPDVDYVSITPVTLASGDDLTIDLPDPLVTIS